MGLGARLDPEFIDEAVEEICRRYLEAGGKEEAIDRERTYWTISGIMAREGKDGVNRFLANYRPIVKTRKWRAYA